MNIASEKVSKIVAKNYKTASVFTDHGIDFCCNGGIPLEDACKNNNVNLQELVLEIDKALSQPEENSYEEMEMSKLVDYIIDNHHAYIRKTTPALSAYLQKVCSVHGQKYPELSEINELFEGSVSDLSAHMQKEEQILFPFIKSLDLNWIENKELPDSHFGHVQNPIAMMKEEHEKEGSRFKKIAGLTNNYQPPKGACQTFQVAYAMLKDFESDLHKHIHLENNILFPTALKTYRALEG